MEEEWTGYDGGAVQDWHRSAGRIQVAPDVTVIPPEAFRECGTLRAVDLGNVATISARAFYLCRSLERITWPAASAVEIGESAFAGCVSLGEMNLNNTTKIGLMAFYGCNALARVAIPSTVVEIEKFAFDGCRNLAGVDIGEGIHRIGQGAFRYCKALRRIDMPSSVTAIEAEAFRECTRLAEVELNEGLQHIGANAFGTCSSLASISIPSTTLKVGGAAFTGCARLCDVALSMGLRAIGERAFDKCRSLERITIPSSVKFVGSGAFWHCRFLSEVTLREGIHFIDAGAFSDCPKLEHINIPPVALVIDMEIFRCQLMRSTVPATYGGKLVVSKWMQYRRREQLEQAETKVNEILGRDDENGPQKIESVREWFAYYNLLDVTSMLELAIWRASMNCTELCAEARKASRRNCGGVMNIIIPAVLPFLEG